MGLIATGIVGSIYMRAFKSPGWPPALVCSPLFCVCCLLLIHGKMLILLFFLIGARLLGEAVLSSLTLL